MFSYCVLVRGHDFRKAFSKIGALRATTSVPFMALTASAPSGIQSDIVSSLYMSSPVVVSCDLDRPNRATCCAMVVSTSPQCKLLHTLVNNEVQRSKSFHTVVVQYYSQSVSTPGPSSDSARPARKRPLVIYDSSDED